MQQTIKILLADDEPDILEIIGFNLEKAGYFVYKASNGNDAVTIAQKVQPDFFILDVMMPGKTGIEVCNILRNNNQLKDKPIIMLTALNDEQSHITGLEAGADDYIAKPISPKLLVSRVKALLRRTTNEDYKKIIQVGNLTIDPLKYTVTSNGNNVVLARKEFELLHLLASKPERVFLRDEILDQVWGNDVIVGDRTIDVHIRKIRKKMDVDYITTVKGVGYKFVG
ncbi:MAG: response regulator [Bacteroidetes bacterium]|jgi:two-component system alkaline phosphatase synthesis response regulator PhoP|nr:response regulator [Bacteroidota bacterium]